MISMIPVGLCLTGSKKLPQAKVLQVSLWSGVAPSGPQ